MCREVIGSLNMRVIINYMDVNMSVVTGYGKSLQDGGNVM